MLNDPPNSYDALGDVIAKPNQRNRIKPQGLGSLFGSTIVNTGVPLLKPITLPSGVSGIAGVNYHLPGGNFGVEGLGVVDRDSVGYIVAGEWGGNNGGGYEKTWNTKTGISTKTPIYFNGNAAFGGWVTNHSYGIYATVPGPWTAGITIQLGTFNQSDDWGSDTVSGAEQQMPLQMAPVTVSASPDDDNPSATSANGTTQQPGNTNTAQSQGGGSGSSGGDSADDSSYNDDVPVYFVYDSGAYGLNGGGGGNAGADMFNTLE